MKLTMIDLKGHESGVKASPGPWDSRESGVIIGTLPYMSDRILEGDPVDGPAEIWSLAVSLAATAIGASPWKGAESPDDMLSARKDFPVDALLDSMPEPILRDSRVMSLLREMTQPSPVDRPTAARSLQTFS